MTTSFAIIIIGDEILSGKRADKHLPKAIELLNARGLQLAYADYVGDDPARITATLARAFAAARESGDVVFSCGGIGATPDDHTRQSAAAALGVALQLHPQAKALITERMQDTAKEQGVPFEPDRSDNIHRLDMGRFPAGADIIPNPYNKIPGFSCFVDRNTTATKQGPRDWLSQTAGAAAPSGGSRLLGLDASTAGVGGFAARNEVLTKQGPRDWLGQTAGAAAPSGGSRLLGSDTNFASVHSTEPCGQAEGLANLGSDPKNRRGGLHFLPGFPVMAWPMMAWVLDNHYAHLHQSKAYIEKSIIVSGSMEATLTPLMLAIEAEHAGVKVFSLPSVDHPQYGRHIELGVKGSPSAIELAYPALLAGLKQFDVTFGPELVR